MRRLGAFEVKTHFSEILGDVINGEKFVITKHGKQVAMIVPFSPKDSETNPVVDAIRAIRNLRKGIKIGKSLSIKQMIEQGRK